MRNRKERADIVTLRLMLVWDWDNGIYRLTYQLSASRQSHENVTEEMVKSEFDRLS